MYIAEDTRFFRQGPKNAPILVLLDPPNETALSETFIMPKDNFKYLVAHLKKLGFTGQDFTFLTVAPHIPKLKNSSAARQTAFLKEHRDRFVQILSEYSPKLIVTMGALAAKQFLNRPVKITKVRGQIFYDHESECPPYIHTLNVGSVIQSPKNFSSLHTDLVTIKRIQDNNYDVTKMSIASSEEEYKWCTDLTYLLANRPEVLAFDTETTGLGRNDRVITLQLSWEEGSAICIPMMENYYPELKRDHHRLMQQVKILMEDPNIAKVAHNYKFDYQKLKKEGIKVAGDAYCTLLMAAAIDENMTQKNLKECVRRFVPEFGGYSDLFDNEADKSNMIEEDPEQVMIYGCLTADSLVQKGDGSWDKIKNLVDSKYSGTVKSHNGSFVEDCKVIGWYKQDVGQKEWYRLITDTTHKGRHGYLGPLFTPDHEIITNRGKVRVDNLKLGYDKILTDEQCFTKDQLSVFLGCLLGDGGFERKNGKQCGFGFSQSNSRSGYATWKADIFSNYNPRQRKVKNSVSYSLPFSRYLAHLDKTYKTQDTSINRAKKAVITKDLLDDLGDIGLAIWYQDDGTLVRGKRHTSSRIYCTKLLESEKDTVVKWLTDRFGDGVSYNESNGFICISREAFKNFQKAIKPYMHLDCAYKHIDSIETAPNLDTNSGLPYYEVIRGLDPYKIEGKSRDYGTRYCLTVEKNHNFNTKAGFVSNCGDADGVLRLAGVLQDILLKDEKQAKIFFEVHMPATLAFADSLEMNGVPIDTDKLTDFLHELQAEEKRLYNKMIAEVPASIKKRHIEEKKGNVEQALKFTRADFVIDILFSKEGFNLKPVVYTKTTRYLPPEQRVPSISGKDHLPYFEGNLFIADLQQYTKLKKMISTYVGEREHTEIDKNGLVKTVPNTGFWKYIEDGKIYPSYHLHVTNTSRTSSENPNGQNIPVRGEFAKTYQKVFIAPQGWCFIKADFSQAELRVIATMANEPTMIQSYLDGKDIHAITGAYLAGMTYEELLSCGDPEFIKSKRYNAKSANFGMAYGISPNGYREYAYTQYGLKLTEKEAKRDHDNFFKLYSQLPAWHKASIQIAKEKGYIRSLHGWARHLPDIYSRDNMTRSLAERQAVNAPVQKFASDLGVMALTRIHRDLTYNPHIPLKPCMFIHDALVFLVRNDYLEEALPAIKWYMENNPLQEMFGITLPVPMIADVEVGPSLGALSERKNIIPIKPEWFTSDHTLKICS